MKKSLLFLALFLNLHIGFTSGNTSTFSNLSIPIGQAFAAEIPAVNQSATTPQNIMFSNCTKIFSVNKEKLFYLTLASLSANRFSIEEVQTANGYIIFTVNRKQYLATVSGIDGANSILKITPCNNVYNFPPGILLNTFKYIDLNLNTEIKS